MSNFDTLDETTSRNDNDFVMLRQGSSDYKQRRSVLEEGIRAFASNEANQALADARSYADTQDAATLNSAESDASSKANQALADAKTNTTEQLQAHTAEADPHTQYLQKSDGLTNLKISLPAGTSFARLCRLTSLSSRGRSSALFILTGGGDYASTRRDDLLIRVTCRGSYFYGMCIALHARSNNNGFRLWYVVNDSTIDVWVSQAGYKTPYSFIPLETDSVTIDTHTILASSDESLPELTEIPIYTSWDAYNLPVITQAQAEDSSSTTPYAWTPQRVAQVASNQSGGVGKIIFVPAVSAPSGYLKANGASLSRTTYANLWEFAQTSGNLVDQSEKDTGNFGTGDGSTTFTLPDLRGEFPRFWDDGRGIDTGRTIGSWQEDAIRNITGAAALNSEHFDSTASGVFYKTATSARRNSGGSNDNSNLLNFDASRVVPTADENRPRNVALLACIKY